MSKKSSRNPMISDYEKDMNEEVVNQELVTHENSSDRNTIKLS